MLKSVYCFRTLPQNSPAELVTLRTFNSIMSDPMLLEFP